VPHPSYPYDGDVLLLTRKVARGREDDVPSG
jgi:hypothetical protein